jgi:hypothetical protein
MRVAEGRHSASMAEARNARTGPTGSAGAFKPVGAAPNSAQPKTPVRPSRVQGLRLNQLPQMLQLAVAPDDEAATDQGREEALWFLYFFDIFATMRSRAYRHL